MRRTVGGVLAVFLALAIFFAIGPWSLLGLLVLLVPQVRRAARPRHPWWAALACVVVLALLVGSVYVVPAGRLPVPPGAGWLVTPSYVGAAAQPRPLDFEVPQHPHLAQQGRSSMHADGWATDSYPWPGPLGRNPQVRTAWYGIEECATLAFDRQQRIVALCGDVRGPLLQVLDTDLVPRVTRRLPDRSRVPGVMPWEDLCGGAYFYLDEHDRAVVATTDRRVLEFATADADGDPALRRTRSFDLTKAVPASDCLVALMPDWQGLVWFVTQGGRVGTIDPASGRIAFTALHEDVKNSLAVDEHGVYVVTVSALYRMRAGPSGAPRVDWRTSYDRGSRKKPGQLSRGSGTTATVLPGGRVAITDNADPRMHVLFYDTDDGREICRAAVFGAGESATENSLVAVGDGVVVENNYGYVGPKSTLLGKATAPGLARVDESAGRCRVAWTSAEVAPSSVAKASRATGLVYAYTKRPTWWGVAAWYLTAIDARTGRTAFSVRTGLGLLMNNHYSAVSLAPDGSAYVATLGGMVRVRDSS